jgi:hypothetical protein
MRVADPELTVNRFVPVATSLPVVAVTVTGPAVAVGEMARLTVAEVALLMETRVTAIPLPKLNTVVLLKCVESPVIATLLRV